MKSKSRKHKNPELAGSRVKLHFKKHALPPLIGLLAVFLVLGFVDAQFFSSQIAAHLQSNIGSKNTAVYVNGSQDRLLIPKINVDVPVTFEPQASAAAFVKDLQKGVVHYPNTALPGQEGNAVVFGQSGDRWWAAGQYKFVFARLAKLKIGDQITLYYNGNRYAYQMYDTTTVAPRDLTPLNQSSSHILTLMTATPLGSNTNRLTVRASQTYPVVGNDFTSDKSAVLPPGALPVLPG